MGRKSGAEEGPVHSPKGRHNAMKQKNDQTRTQKNKPKPQQAKTKQGSHSPEIT
jgi:hypothetical protein